MNITRMAGVLAATAVTFGIGAVNVAPAWATDNIKPFGEPEGLNGPNSLPYITYTVKNLAPSSDPVPHNGTLYAARLVVDGNYPPQIERFGARTESGLFYPAIAGYSNLGKLYFDVVGPIPNSVVWNDGIRDILAWIPGDPVSESNAAEPPVFPEEGFGAAPPAAAPAATAPTMPAENDAAIVATPNDLAGPTPGISEAEAALPGFNADGGGRGHR
ncbi:MAG: DUF1942 domain-containing protein [Mycobacterium sp.]|nr:DUF1942 domain-containing protein [Mycobacterium sp.]